MPVVLPPEISKTLAPRSPEEAGKVKRVTAATAWKRVYEAMAAYARYGKTAFEVAFEVAFEETPPDLKPRVLALRALMEAEQANKENPSPPPAPLPIEVASALMVFFPNRGFDAIEALSGLPAAFEARIDSLGYEVKWTRGPGVVLIASPAGVNDMSLRARLLAAPSDVRAQCAEVAKRLWPSAAFGQRATLAYTFFENEEWAHEVARTYVEDSANVKRLPIDLLYTIVRDVGLMRSVVEKRLASRSLFEVVRTFGDGAFEIVAEVFKTPRDEWDLKHSASALALFDDARAAELLVSGLGNAKVRPSIAEYCVRFPKTGRAALEPLAKGKGRIAKLANELLRAIEKTEANAAIDAASSEDGETPTDEDAIDAELPKEKTEEASADELPWILVKPPWLNRKAIPKRVRPTIADVPMLPREERVTLTEELDAIGRDVLDPSTPTFKLEADAGTNATLTRGEGADTQHIDDASLLEHWERVGLFSQTRSFGGVTDYLAYVVHRLGVRAIPGFVRFLAQPGAAAQHKGDKRILFAIDSPRIAAGLAKLLTVESRGYWEVTWGPFVRRWLRLHPETAVIGLVPAVLAGDEDAERALRFLRDDLEVDVLAVAKPYGEESITALETILAWDTRYDLPARLPKLPPIYRPESITRPLLKNGKRIPIGALTHLGTMLAFTSKRLPYAGIADVKAACEPRSLAELAWDLAKGWEMAGGKKNTEWMMESLIHFADDEVVRRTTPAMRSQAVSEVLQIIGTDAAVMELITIAARAASGNNRYSWAANVIHHRIDQIALERGLAGAAELEDAILPVRDVDYKGFELDYGGRVFQVGFDERLEVFIAGEDGTRLRALPPGRKTDDKKKVEAAKLVWQDLREEVSAVVARRLVWLEQAMIRGATWTPAELRRRYIEHPLLRHLGRVLLWEQAGKRFRITEDDTFADVDDHTFDLDPTLPVRLAHPGRLHADRAKNDEEAARWVQTFFDYRIVQPFTQVGRAVRAAPPDQQKERVFTRSPKGVTSEEMSKRLRERGYSLFAGQQTRKLLSRGAAFLTVAYANQQVSAITLRLEPSWIDFDPVDIAECLGDIEW